MINAKVRMTFVVDGVIRDGEYEFPVDFVPSFLSPKQEDAPAVEEVTTPEAPLVAQPLGEPLCSIPIPSKKKRTLMGTIRAGWFVGFTAIGESLTYALNNLTNLNLPPGTATAIGALGYGIKKALWPDSLV